MDHDFDAGDVTFVEFPLPGGAAREGAATIAAFAPPAVNGGLRTARACASESTVELIGESPEICEVTRCLQRIAPSLAAVMLVGESGTGKEVAAQLLHLQSPRAKGPFVAINCGAIPANLVEAELFGYERGAFTGAVRQHEGHFERASGGTLFLDEIAEMPIGLQAKLLRVIETGRLLRVGGTQEIAVDVRVVSATNRPPETFIRDGRLREDLFYRLAVLLVHLPPLRQRGGDIDLLARAFLRRLNAEYGTHKRFAPGTLAEAKAHPWPGNVRELRNCIERSFVMSDDLVVLDLRSILPAMREEGDGDSIRLPIGIRMAEAERELLLATLRHCGGNKRRTADMLGVSLKTVYNKLIAYGVDPPLLRVAGED